MYAARTVGSGAGSPRDLPLTARKWNLLFEVENCPLNTARRLTQELPGAHPRSSKLIPHQPLPPRDVPPRRELAVFSPRRQLRAPRQIFPGYPSPHPAPPPQFRSGQGNPSHGGSRRRRSKTTPTLFNSLLPELPNGCLAASHRIGICGMCECVPPPVYFLFIFPPPFLSPESRSARRVGGLVVIGNHGGNVKCAKLRRSQMANGCFIRGGDSKNRVIYG